MDGNSMPSPKSGYPIDSADAENFFGNSDLLVATIRETSDKISLIEDIFCKQLYPNIQSKYNNLQKICFDAKRAAEYEWKEKERNMLHQIDTLQFEKQYILDENRHLKLSQSQEHVKELQDKLKYRNREIANGRELEQDLRKLLESKSSVILHIEKRMKELEEENNLIRKKKRNLDLETEELRLDLMKKSKEVDEGMELHNRLVQMVQSKASLISQKEMELKENEERTTELLAKLKDLEKEVKDLQMAVKEKTDQMEKGKELQENLSQKIEMQSSELSNNRQLVDYYEVENKQLRGQIRNLQENVNELQRDLHKKIEEVEEGKNMQQKFLQQNDSELLKARQEVKELQKEKKQLLVKLTFLEDKVCKLHVDHKETKESTKENELHGKMLEQIETRDAELRYEKNKKREAIEAFKKLKSQYKFLLAKSDLTPENMLPQTSPKDERDSTGLNQNQLVSPGTERKVPNGSVLACQATKENVHPNNLEENNGINIKSIQKSTSGSPCTSTPSVPPKPTNNPTSSSLAGKKRAASHWRETRSHQNRSGPDPHDDFLDTPLENIKGNFKKATKEEIHQIPGPVPKYMVFDSSDDETQDLSANNLGLKRQQTPSLPMTETKGFKYVEPVRKKAERENLKGVECKQCKKFYDAVLPDVGGNGTNGNKQNLRCEHHDGVSRHRYRYAPPLTPEGFWNIGFESEM